jgi:glutamate-5-semialdehyde dehydrogenase
MAIADDQDLRTYCEDVARRAKAATAALAMVTGQQKNDWLCQSAAALRSNLNAILMANSQDIAAAPEFGLTAAQVDRLKLDEQRVDGIARALEEIAMLREPVGEIIESTRRPNGLDVQKVRVPLGVVFFIY